MGTDQNADADADADDSGRPRLTRRRLLYGAGGVVGLAGAGGLYVSSELDGDFGDETAPDDFPTVTTRGRVDPETDTDSEEAIETEGSWAFDDADELFVFVHGFDTDDATARDQAYTTAVGLEAVRPAPVVAYSWDSDTEWETAKELADANAPSLADWLIEWADDDGRPVHLLGYSLGARVVCETLVALASAGRVDAVSSVSLLGGAVPNDSVEADTRYGEAIDELDAPVANFHNGDDRILGWFYRLTDRTRAVGETGIRDPEAAPAGYTDVDVTEQVPDHYSYFEPEEGCLPQVTERL
ncbi:MAG: alpha/beta fold hydrolase [Halohasta sp.]